MTDSLRYDVMHRDGFRCVLCGASTRTDSNIVLHVDHVVPLAKGGKTELSNLRTLCERCNLGKRDKIEVSMVQQQQDVSLKDAKKIEVRQVSDDNADREQGTKRREAELITVLKEHSIKYIDNRVHGGNLWVFGGHELDSLMAELQKKGYKFYYREQGGKATKGVPAWFMSQ